MKQLETVDAEFKEIPLEIATEAYVSSFGLRTSGTSQYYSLLLEYNALHSRGEKRIGQWEEISNYG